MNKKLEHNNGFTLIELAVVLVIIGLIVGGIMTGQSLLKASKLRQQITQFESYKQAVSTFEDLYGGIPGDITNATELFGATGVTNGNGNRLVEVSAAMGSISNNCADNSYFDAERAQFFVQLHRAKLSEQSFDGSATLGNGYPRTALNKNGGMIASGPWSWDFGNSQYLNTSALISNNLYIAAIVSQPSEFGVNGSNHDDDIGIFTPTEASEIDRKMDDGVPSSGLISAQAFNVTVWCANATVYNLSESSTRVCNLMYDISER
jgi:prepilin-type N-terminal cleavage/methylation domain-containing protein